MRRRRRALWKSALAALAVGIAAAAFFCLRPRSAPPPAAPAGAPTAIPAGVIAPPPSRPVPSRLEAERHPLHDLLRSGRYAEAAVHYPTLLSELAREWGEGSPDLASYHYYPKFMATHWNPRKT